MIVYSHHTTTRHTEQGINNIFTVEPQHFRFPFGESF